MTAFALRQLFSRATFFCFAFLLATSSALAVGDGVVSLSSLLNEMTDRAALARVPDPPYTVGEASSHDRRKTNPADPIRWHSNNDHEQFIRTEEHYGRREWVIMEDAGPGAITRFWTPLLADKDHQIIRFYLDGSDRPSIEANFNDLLSGRLFVRPPLAFVSWDQTDLRDELKESYKPPRGVGADLYLPIPYGKSCKITLDQIPFYYVINYRHYAENTNVRTFSFDDFKAAETQMRIAGERLINGMQTSTPVVAGSNTRPDAIPNGDFAPPAVLEHDAEDVFGEESPVPGAVTSIEIRFDPSQGDEILRSAIIQAEFDDQHCIWSPLGEFFGCGPRLRNVSDFDRTVTDKGTLECRWIMPFKKHLRLSLKNLGGKQVKVAHRVVTQARAWDDRSMYFHATWHCTNDIETRPYSDWNYLEATGAGVYVGDTLSVYNPVPAWYGEGDERVYVDGESLPSHIGTGTEDYYGYAWGMPDFFSSPFLSEPQRDVQNRDNWTGYTTTSRLRSLDAIPFNKSIRHDMEIWNWADTKVDYAVTCFWYARPGAVSNREPQPTEAARPVHPAPPDPQHFKIAGAIECESMTIADKSPGLLVGTQDAGLGEGQWSGGRQLFVQATQPGQFIELEIPVTDPRPQRVMLYATKSYDYATLHFSLNGIPSQGDFDAYAAQAQTTGPIPLGTSTPINGKILLRVETKPSNAAASKGRLFFGLDCVTLEPK